MTPELAPWGSTPPAPPSLPPAAEPPAPPRWSLTDLVLLLGLGVVAFIVAYLAVTMGFLAYQSVHPRRDAAPESASAAILALIFQMIFYVLLFGVIYAVVTLRGRRPFWRALKWKRLTLTRAAGFLAGGTLLAVAVQFAPTLFPDKNEFPLQQLFNSPGTAYAVGAFAVLIAPLMEEMVFRGVLFSIFEDVAGLRFSIVATAVLFTAMHIPEYSGAWNHLFLLLIVGFTFSFARGMTGSLAPSVFLHTAYNFVQLVILFIATDHFQKMQSALLR